MTAPQIVGRLGPMATKNKRYADGTSTYQRVSTLLKNIETDTYNLDQWRKRQVAIGMSMRSDLVLGVAAAAQFNPETGKLTDEAKHTINDLCTQAMDAAASKAGANAGSAVHTATERLDLGEPAEQIALPYPYSADLTAYATLKRAMGLAFRPEHIERTVVIDALGAAGTFDRLGTSTLLEERGILAPGELIVVDVKTEDDPTYNLIHICPQLASYANGDRMFTPAPTAEDRYAGTYEPMPAVNKTVGLVIHIKKGHARPLLVNLESGWRSALRAAEQRDELALSKRKLGEDGAWVLHLPVDLPPATELVQTAVARGPMGFSAPEGTPAGYAEPDDPLGELRGQLIEAIWQAAGLGDLARLYEAATAQGVAWSGAVQMAGTARQRIIECPQRAMHDPSTTAKCACGWTREVAA